MRQLDQLRAHWAESGIPVDPETGLAAVAGGALAQGGLSTEYLEQREVNSEFGEIWHEGHYQGDLIAFAGSLSIEKREVPVAGQDNIIYRRGRISRTGTLSVAKCDSRWEAYMIYFAGLSVQARRKLRNEGINPVPPTVLMIKLDDPDSWGAEEIALYGVQFWEIGLGYAGQTIIQRDIPVTWQSEKMLRAIPRPGNMQAAEGIESNPEGQTYPAFGETPVI